MGAATILMPDSREVSVPITSPEADAGSALVAAGVCKTYPGASTEAVSDFSLTARTGEVLALLGPSGCGKTTALRMIAGLERGDAGTIEVGGQRVFGPRTWVVPEKRAVGMVFQDYALFPHMTVRGNVAYGLNKLPRGERRDRMAHVLRLTGLEPYEHRYPHELSGGQQQRVAIARAIAPRPALVLLDEPFSNLDVSMRAQVRSEALSMLRRAGVTVILVTHDQDEAFVAADRIAVMEAGRIHQVAPAEDLYYRPSTRFVAQFVGIANFLRGDRNGGVVVTPLGEVSTTVAGSGAVDVLLRPEQIEIGADGATASVTDREFHGHDWMYTFALEAGQVVRVVAHAHLPLEIGQRVHLRARDRILPSFPLDS